VFSVSPTVEGLADAVVAAGVRRVEGDLLADETLFDSSRWQRGWLSSYQRGDVDVGNISAMTVNMGCANIVCSAVAQSPAVTAAKLLREALRARDVELTGTVRTGAAAEDAVDIAVVRSPPLREIVSWTNRWSVNYPPELLLKGLGAAFGGAGTTRAGAAVVRTTLAGLKIGVGGLVMEDGSGLSVLNRVAPATLAQVLRLMVDMPGPDGAALRDSMPVAGRPGTLLRRMRTAPTLGNLRGKTGLIRGVRGLAGWVRARDGSIVVYVSLFNRVRSPTRVTAVLDGFGRALASLP
ncbi:MAG: D-alanyl-D-alanine carboxypeptidase/D-alanyl-D-alanine endopeptidase, partial [Actinomycetota bacterium]